MILVICQERVDYLECKIKPKNLLFRSIVIAAIFTAFFLFLRIARFDLLLTQCISAIQKHGIILAILALFPIAMGIYFPASFFGGILGLFALFVWKIIFGGDDSIEYDGSDSLIILSYSFVSGIFFGYTTLMAFSSI